MNTAYIVLMLLGAYLVGAVPVGYLIVKKMTGIDIRMVGSGKIGATNVERQTGKGPANITLLSDALKGYFISLIALSNFGLVSWITGAALLLVVFGHRFSIFLFFASPPKYEDEGRVPALTKIKQVFSRLKGGSGMASFLGFIFPILIPYWFIYPWTIAVTIGLAASWLAAKKTKKRMSLANLLLLALIILYFGIMAAFTHFSYYPYLIGFITITALFIIGNHQENIRRLLKGIEPTSDFLG